MESSMPRPLAGARVRRLLGAMICAAGLLEPARAFEIVPEPAPPQRKSAPAKPAPKAPAPAVAPAPAAAPATAAGAATAAGSKASTPAPKDSGPAPDVKVGDRWVWNLHDEKGLSATSRQIATVSKDEFAAGNGQRFNRGLGRLNLIDSKGKTTHLLVPSGYSMKFPLSVGKTWTENYESQLADADRKVIARIQSESRVVRFERITVPAGPFDTWVVETRAQITLTAGGTTQERLTRWYAPAARGLVRQDFEQRDASGAIRRSNVLEMLTMSLMP